MAERPVPLLVLAELSFDANNALVTQAIGRGALDVQIKPTPSDTKGAARLRNTIRQLSRVRVVRHLPGGMYAAPAPLPVSGPTALTAGAPSVSATAQATKDRVLGGHARMVIGFGASAGGPSALAAILARLPAELPACVAVVQHLPSGFSDSFAGFLRTHTRLRVAIVRDVTEATPGTVFLPGDGCHLFAASSDAFSVSREPPVRGHRPSVDVLFRSLAQHYGGRAVGVILSGIGRDGCEGLQEMHTQGAFTIAQDEHSSAVYGMPRTAKECGAAEVSLPPEEIAKALLKRLSAREPGV